MREHTESSHIIPVSTAICNKYVINFWKHVAKGKDHECWLWTGGISGDGYGMAHIGKCVKAHRVSWLINRGPIPVGICVLHDCPEGDNPMCVNPAHLWLGTNSENMADMVSKGRQHMGTAHHSAKLNEDKVRQIRLLRQQGETLMALASKFGINNTNISRIAKFQKWKQVK